MKKQVEDDQFWRIAWALTLLLGITACFLAGIFTFRHPQCNEMAWMRYPVETFTLGTVEECR